VITDIAKGSCERVKLQMKLKKKGAFASTKSPASNGVPEKGGRQAREGCVGTRNEVDPRQNRRQQKGRKKKRRETCMPKGKKRGREKTHTKGVQG